MPRPHPYARRTYQGRTLDNRTIDAFEWADRIYHHKTGRHLTIVQGSYNRGGVSASAGTHDGGGALDLSVLGLTTRQIHHAVGAMRRAGFAAWYRHPLPGVWGPHIHAELLNHATASAGAKQQWASYRAHRDGLAGNHWDGTWRPKRARVWSYKRRRPIMHR